MSETRVIGKDDFDIEYINLNSDGTTSLVIRLRENGERIELPGGPVEYVDTPGQPELTS